MSAVFECIEVHGDTIRTFKIGILQVSAIEGCPLSGISQYYDGNSFSFIVRVSYEHFYLFWKLPSYTGSGYPCS